MCRVLQAGLVWYCKLPYADEVFELVFLVLLGHLGLLPLDVCLPVKAIDGLERLAGHANNTADDHTPLVAPEVGHLPVIDGSLHPVAKRDSIRNAARISAGNAIAPESKTQKSAQQIQCFSKCLPTLYNKKQIAPPPHRSSRA